MLAYRVLRWGSSWHLSCDVKPFDKHHKALQSGRENIARVQGPVRGGGERRLSWKTTVRSSHVVEVTVAILTIKFTDGSIWQAPNVELVGFF